MEAAARCRRTARTAVQDVEPDALRETIHEVIDDGSTAPGALVVLSARSAADDPDLGEFVDDRAAGVQLIYEGLGLIRELALVEPWDGVVTVDGDPGEDLTEENLAMLAADVLVARGFYLLARTDAAGKAVETVRDFARDQTRVRDGEDRDVELEVDVLQLAVIAGRTAVGGEATPETLSAVEETAREMGHPLPSAETVLSGYGDDADVQTGAADGRQRTSATDP